MLSNELNDKIVQLTYGSGIQEVKILTRDGQTMTIEDVVYDPENKCFFIQTEWEE